MAQGVAIAEEITSCPQHQRIADALKNDRDARHDFNGALNHITGPIQMVVMMAAEEPEKAQIYAEQLKESTEQFKRLLSSAEMQVHFSDPSLTQDASTLLEAVEKATDGILLWLDAQQDSP